MELLHKVSRRDVPKPEIPSCRAYDNLANIAHVGDVCIPRLETSLGRSWLLALRLYLMDAFQMEIVIKCAQYTFLCRRKHRRTQQVEIMEIFLFGTIVCFFII